MHIASKFGKMPESGGGNNDNYIPAARTHQLQIIHPQTCMILYGWKLLNKVFVVHITELWGRRFKRTVVSQSVYIFPTFEASFKMIKGIHICSRSWVKDQKLVHVLCMMEIFVNVVLHKFYLCLQKYGHTYFPTCQQTWVRREEEVK